MLFCVKIEFAFAFRRRGFFVISNTSDGSRTIGDFIDPSYHHYRTSARSKFACENLLKLFLIVCPRMQ